MKRVFAFVTIFITLTMGLLAFFGVKTNAAPNIQFYESRKIYFRDFAVGYYVGPDDYDFDLSYLDNYYDYFIFNFGDNKIKTIYTNGDIPYFSVNTGFGVRLIERDLLDWQIYFSNDFEEDEYYIIAYNYEFVSNLNENLTNVYDAGYDLALDHVYEYGFTPLDTEYENQGSWPYQLGYYNGVESVEVIDYDDAYDAGYDKGVMDVFYNGFVNTDWNYKQSKPYELGFYDGASNNSDFSFTGLLGQVFVGLGSLLAIELLPGISIGAVIAVPIVFGIIAFIIGKRGGKDD